MKRILLSAAVLVGVLAFLLLEGGASNANPSGTYKIELNNAFGLVQGADFKVAGVRAGTISSIDLCYSEPSAHCQSPLNAVVTVQVSSSGFGSFRTDAFCQSRPQSLIGEYFIDCDPGHSGSSLAPGSTIPVTRTESTIPGDLLQDVMRMPYRERFTLIINELGAAVASRSTDLQSALQRAVPALTETDNLLNLLANDSATLQALTRDSNSVITALANNSAQVQRFIVEAGNAAADTATQQNNLRLTFQKLPGLLEQLRPTMAKLGSAVLANTPVVTNLNAAAGQIDRLFVDLPPFSHSALPAIKSLGKASVTGRSAVIAANPTIAHLNQFARSTPELGQNLAIVLRDLDSRARAVEPDPRSPGGQGFTGLEALLGYVFNQTLAINAYGPFGHMLTVDAFFDKMCSNYASPVTVAMELQQNGAAYRHCYSWLGPNQPGINETDPSNPGGAVPDPGGAPPGYPGPKTSAAKLNVSALTSRTTSARAASPTSPTAGGSSTAAGSGTSGTAGPATSGSGAGSGTSPVPTPSLGKTIGQVLSLLGGSPSNSSPLGPSSGSSPSAAPGSQAQQLLNYLLAP